MEHEFYLYHCADCVLFFGVETAFEGQSETVCPYCQSGDAIEDAGVAIATLTREPEVEAG